MRRIARVRPVDSRASVVLAAAGVVEDQVPHRLPDLARVVGGGFVLRAGSSRSSLWGEGLGVERRSRSAAPTPRGAAGGRQQAEQQDGDAGRRRASAMRGGSHAASSGPAPAWDERRSRRRWRRRVPGRTGARSSRALRGRRPVRPASRSTAVLVIGGVDGNRSRCRRRRRYASSQPIEVSGARPIEHAGSPSSEPAPAMTSGTGAARPTIRPETARRRTVISRDRRGREARLDRREVAHLLQVEGVEEEEAAEGGEGGHRQRDRGGERHRAEEAQVDQRLARGVARSAAGPAGRRRWRRRRRRSRGADQPASGASMIPKVSGCQQHDHEQPGRAGSKRRGSGAFDSGDEPQRQRDRQQAERYVDPGRSTPSRRRRRARRRRPGRAPSRARRRRPRRRSACARSRRSVNVLR